MLNMHYRLRQIHFGFTTMNEVISEISIQFPHVEAETDELQAEQDMPTVTDVLLRQAQLFRVGAVTRTFRYAAIINSFYSQQVQ